MNAAGTEKKTLRSDLIEDPDRARLALSPIRRQLLARLRRPASAAQLAVELDMPRQKLGYHLRALEAAGLIGLAEARGRRGFTERLLVSRADAFIIDPSIMGGPGDSRIEAQDRYAASHLVQTAAHIVRNVTRMRAAAETEGKRLLTFTIEADVGFASPGDIESFTDRLADAVATLAKVYPAEGENRRYRVIVGGHPAAADVHPKNPS
jgi:DNA-binding transcriptional ArsR family regulator